MANPFAIAAGINIGSSLLGSVFGGKSDAEKAQEFLMRFAREGLPDDIKQKIIQNALAALNRGARMRERSIGARLEAGGIDPRSGLAEGELRKPGREALQMRSKAISDIELGEFEQRLNAARSALGAGDVGGLNFFETLAGTSGNLLPILALGGRGAGGGSNAQNLLPFVSTSGLGAGVDPFSAGVGAGAGRLRPR